jgi:hypothetical protein
MDCGCGLAAPSLEEVSTVRGSGWVDEQEKFLLILNPEA